MAQIVKNIKEKKQKEPKKKLEKINDIFTIPACAFELMSLSKVYCVCQQKKK